jgi:outer membrane protein TolC
VLSLLPWSFSLAQSEPKQEASPSRWTLDTLAEGLRARLLDDRKETLQRQRLALESDILEASDDTKFTLRNQAGLRVQPSEKGPELEDSSRVVLLPREAELFQSHTITAARELHDFGRKSAVRSEIEARAKLLPFDRRIAQERVRWRAAALLLDARVAATEAQAVVALSENASARLATFEREYRRGLRSEADKTRAEADQLRAVALLERAREALRTRMVRLAAEIGAEPPLDAAQAVSLIGGPLPTRSVEAWKVLFASVRATSDAVRKAAQDAAPNAGPSASGAPTLGGDATALALERLALEKAVIDQRAAALDGRTAPRLTGEIGAQLPGELLPLRSNVFAQVTFLWEIPWNGLNALEREGLARERSLLDLEADEIRRDAATRVRATAPVTDAHLRRLEVLERQRSTLDRLRELVRRRYASGRATALELSSVEDDLLSNASDVASLQGDIHAALLTDAEARGDFALARLLLAD